jgi:hypothetical protein
VSEPADLLALELGRALRAVGPHHDGEKQRRPRHGGDRLDGRALNDEGHRRAGAERDVEAIRRHRLLHAGIAGKGDRLDLEPVLGEESLAHADIERHERERLGHGFADAKRLGGAGGRGDDHRAGRERKRADRSANRGAQQCIDRHGHVSLRTASA